MVSAQYAPAKVVRLGHQKTFCCCNCSGILVEQWMSCGAACYQCRSASSSRGREVLLPDRFLLPLLLLPRDCISTNKNLSLCTLQKNQMDLMPLTAAETDRALADKTPSQALESAFNSTADFLPLRSCTHQYQDRMHVHCPG